MALKKLQESTPSHLAARAIESRDGILVGELLRQVAFSAAPKDARSEALQRIALHHAQMAHVVIGTLSTLSMIDPSSAKRLAHVFLSERQDPERDAVYAIAARILVEAQPVDGKDLMVIARCASSSFDAVKGDVIRAINNLPHFIAASILESAQAGEQTPAMRGLVSLLEGRCALRRSVLPAAPRESLAIEDEVTTNKEVPVRRKRPRIVKAVPQIRAREALEPPAMVSPATSQSARREPAILPTGPSGPQPEITSVPAKQSISPLSPDQRSYLSNLVTQEVRPLSDTLLVTEIHQEKEPERLLSLLCELTLRQGRQVRDGFLNHVVWLSSTPFAAANPDIRMLIKILLSDQ